MNLTKTWIGFVVVLSSTLLLNPVRSGKYCYSSIAAGKLNTLIAGGMSGDEAFQIVSEDYLDGTRKCFFEMKGEVNQTKMFRPYAYRYLFQ